MSLDGNDMRELLCSLVEEDGRVQWLGHLVHDGGYRYCFAVVPGRSISAFTGVLCNGVESSFTRDIQAKLVDFFARNPRFEQLAMMTAYLTGLWSDRAALDGEE